MKLSLSFSLGRFVTWLKIQDKILNILKTIFWDKIKAFFIIFKVLSVAKNWLGPDSAPSSINWIDKMVKMQTRITKFILGFSWNFLAFKIYILKKLWFQLALDLDFLVVCQCLLCYPVIYHSLVVQFATDIRS